MVIMGITRPDDPADMANLNSFRELGMKVASIGPTSSDARLPGGDTVPKMTDVHVGRVYDTNGLYAIPGFNRKVCPTSGIMDVMDHVRKELRAGASVVKTIEKYGIK